MLNRVIIVLGFLAGSILAAWGASSTLSGLSAGGNISGTDLFYDVQTVGAGGVKVTGTQFLSFVFGNVSGNCTASVSGAFTCSSFATNSVTSIAAGTNITTSGTATNTTVNVIATPTFTSVNTTLASVIGWLTAPGVNMQTASIIGNLTGSTAQFTNTLTGTSAVFQTMTVNNLTPTGPNCLQETGGVIQATNATCGGGGGTPGGATTQVQFNNASAFAGDPGFTYTTPAAVVLSSGILSTTNVKALSIFQTWNSATTSFDAPLFMNVTATANAASSVLEDLQVNGSSVFNINPSGTIAITDGSHPISIVRSTIGGFAAVTLNGDGSQVLQARNFDGGLIVASSGYIGFYGAQGVSSVSIGGTQGSGSGKFLPFSMGTNPVGLAVYNTVDSPSGPTNYERALFDWTVSANNLTIGTQAGGTGVGRNVLIVSSNTRAQTISTTATTFAAALNAPAIAQLGATTTGYACWTTGTGAISEDSTACLASLRRLKKDIVPFTDTTAELMALKPSQFQWKDPIDNNQRGQQLGFVAEDVHDVDARLASYDGSGALHGWRQDAMIAALVRGFQEQQAIIQRQQAEIDELKQGRLP